MLAESLAVSLTLFLFFFFFLFPLAELTHSLGPILRKEWLAGNIGPSLRGFCFVTTVTAPSWQAEGKASLLWPSKWLTAVGMTCFSPPVLSLNLTYWSLRGESRGCSLLWESLESSTEAELLSLSREDKWGKGVAARKAVTTAAIVCWKVNKGLKQGQLLHERCWEGETQMEKMKNGQRRCHWDKVGEQRKGQEDGNEREHHLLSGRQETRVIFRSSCTGYMGKYVFLFIQ